MLTVSHVLLPGVVRLAQRVTRNIHGIKINVLQTGQLGTFSITTLILQLTTSLALLKITTTVVDVLAVSVLPHRAQYRDAKVDEIVVDEKSDHVSKAAAARVVAEDRARKPCAPALGGGGCACSHPRAHVPPMLTPRPSHAPRTLL